MCLIVSRLSPADSMITLLEESTASLVSLPFLFSFTSFMTLMLLPSSAVLSVRLIPTDVPKLRYNAWLILSMVSCSVAPFVNVMVLLTPSSVMEKEFSPSANALRSASCPFGSPVTLPDDFTEQAVANCCISLIFIELTALDETELILMAPELLIPVIVLNRLWLMRLVSPEP